jgi:hypothetical protein
MDFFGRPNEGSDCGIISIFLGFDKYYYIIPKWNMKKIEWDSNYWNVMNWSFNFEKITTTSQTYKAS